MVRSKKEMHFGHESMPTSINTRTSPYNITNVRNNNSIGHRWSHISQECSKFTTAYNGIVVRVQIGIGVNVQVAQAMGAFKAQNNGKSFNLVHACLKLHGAPKFTELVAHRQLQNKNTGKEKSKKRSSDGGTIDLETSELDGGKGKRSDRP
jgi:hypothetical protein